MPLRREQKQLTQKVKAGAWQHQAQIKIHKCLELIGEPVDKIPSKSALKN